MRIPSGGGGVTKLTKLTDVSQLDTPAKNDVVIWNGTEFVFAPYNTTFTFSISSFSDGQSSGQLIGSGVWKAVGALNFTAAYNNGPASGGYVSSSVWTGSLTMANDYQGPTTNTEAVNYPISPGSISFVLHATDGETPLTSTITHIFYNYRFWGISTKTSGYTESDVEGLAGSELASSRADTFTVTPSVIQYILFASPVRLGACTFFVGGFEGGFESPETISVTNSAGFTENYYVYRSTNIDLGTTTVTVT